MNFFLKKQVSVWLVVILILINIAAILTIVYHVYFDGKREPSTTETADPGKIITRELNLDQAQMQQYHNLQSDFSQESQPVVDQMTEARLGILEELSRPDSNPSKLDSLASVIGDLHYELKRITIHHLLKVKAICDSSQQNQLHNLIRDMMQSEGAFKGMGKKFQLRHGKGGGRGWQNKN
jgi:hypothetical protein